MSDLRSTDNRPHDRRSFFRRGAHELLRPLAAYLESRLPALPPGPVLRPPGALPEADFLETCYRCGNCSAVCPVQAIRSMQTDEKELAGTPYIDPDVAACVACADVACTKACPSGALRVIADARDIDMGLAVPEHSLCVRRHGEDCTLCIDKCPLGSEAIGLDAKGQVAVIEQGCVGCGVCQLYCPTRPKAIVVRPKTAQPARTRRRH